MATASPPDLSYNTRPVENQDLFDVNLRCSVCTKPLSEEQQRKGANVCSEPCRNVRGRKMRSFRKAKRCTFCQKPSTYTERRSFKRFQQWEEDYPELAFPQVAYVLGKRGVEPEVFRAAVREARDQDFSFEFTPVALKWPRFPKDDAAHENLDRCIAELQAHWREVEAKKS